MPSASCASPWRRGFPWIRPLRPCRAHACGWPAATSSPRDRSACSMALTCTTPARCGALIARASVDCWTSAPSCCSRRWATPLPERSSTWPARTSPPAPPSICRPTNWCSTAPRPACSTKAASWCVSCVRSRSRPMSSASAASTRPSCWMRRRRPAAAACGVATWSAMSTTVRC